LLGAATSGGCVVSTSVSSAASNVAVVAFLMVAHAEKSSVFAPASNTAT
jgi:hypothetical protein